MRDGSGFDLVVIVPRDPSIQIIPTLGPKACKYYLHWAIWIPRVLLWLTSLLRLGCRVLGLAFFRVQLGFQSVWAGGIECRDQSLGMQSGLWVSK